MFEAATVTQSIEHPQFMVRRLGLVDYVRTWQAMRDFSTERDADAPDEIWLLQHPPVYTLGLSCKPQDYDDLGTIPLVASDRGGKITFHGPGQLVAYVLMDLRRRGWGVLGLVEGLEQAVIDLLADYGIQGGRHAGAPGVYVDGRKVAALGLRVRRGRSYHGLSINVGMDLEPFRRIHPCGYEGLRVTQLADLGVRAGIDVVADQLLARLTARLGYTD